MMKKVMVFGTFDILHKGHLSLFRQARKYGDYLIVVIARDSTVAKVKCRKPRHDERQRLQKVRRFADKAVLGYARDMHKIIRELKPDVICLGYDQSSFVRGINRFNIPVKRLKPYHSHRYKSSILAKKR